MGLAGAAVEAHTAGDVGLGRYVVADLHVLDPLADLDDGPGELMAQRQRRLDPALRPGVPPPNVNVRPTATRRFDLHQDLMVPRRWDWNKLDPEARLGGKGAR